MSNSSKVVNSDNVSVNSSDNVVNAVEIKAERANMTDSKQAETASSTVIVEKTVVKPTSKAKRKVVRQKSKVRKVVPTSKAPQRHTSEIQAQGFEFKRFIDKVAVKTSIATADMKSANQLKSLLNQRRVDGHTLLGRKGSTKYDKFNNIAGLVDNFIIHSANNKTLTVPMVEKFIDTCISAENNSAKCGHLQALGQLQATFHHTSQCLMAIRPVSKNSKRALKTAGYTVLQSEKILASVESLAWSIRPIFMKATNLVKAKTKVIKAYMSEHGVDDVTAIKALIALEKSSK